MPRSLGAAAAAIAALVGTREDIGSAVSLLFARTLGDVTALVRGDSEATCRRSAIGALIAMTVPALVASVLAGIVASARPRQAFALTPTSSSQI